MDFGKKWTLMTTVQLFLLLKPVLESLEEKIGILHVFTSGFEYLTCVVVVTVSLLALNLLTTSSAR